MNILEIIRGDDSELEFTFTDVDDVAVDLTGSEIFFTVKEDRDDDDDDALIKKDFEFDGSGTDGVVEVWLEATDTDIAIGEYSYDIQIKDNEGYIFSSQVGKFVVKEDVTVRTTISV